MTADFRLGSSRVEPGLNRISRSGTSRRLEPKVMEGLVCLARHPEETLSKEQLLQAVWPGTFVSDDVLTKSVSELRRVLEDDPKEPRYIQTAPNPEAGFDFLRTEFRFKDLMRRLGLPPL